MVTAEMERQAVLDLLSDIAPDEILSKAYCHVQELLAAASAFLIDPDQLDDVAYQEQMAFLKLYGIRSAQEAATLIAKCKAPSLFACAPNLLLHRIALRLKEQLGL